MCLPLCSESLNVRPEVVGAEKSGTWSPFVLLAMFILNNRNVYGFL